MLLNLKDHHMQLLLFNHDLFTFLQGYGKLYLDTIGRDIDVGPMTSAPEPELRTKVKCMNGRLALQRAVVT